MKSRPATVLATLLWASLLVSMAPSPGRADECPPVPSRAIGAHIIIPEVIVRNVDSQEAEKIDDLNGKITGFIQEWYPQMRQNLSLPLPQPLPSDSVICVFLHHVSEAELNGSNPPGSASIKAHGDRNIIRIYDSFLQKHRHSNFHWGLLTHEMTHLLQYPYSIHMSRWIQEGMADYVLYNIYFSKSLDWFLARTAQTLKLIDTDSAEARIFQQNYQNTICPYNQAECLGFRQDGYRMHKEQIHIAGMMVMIDKLYVPGFLPVLHRRLFKARKDQTPFSDLDLSNFLYRLSDKTLEQLWCEYLARSEGISNPAALSARCPDGYMRNPIRRPVFYQGLPQI